MTYQTLKSKLTKASNAQGIRKDSDYRWADEYSLNRIPGIIPTLGKQARKAYAMNYLDRAINMASGSSLDAPEWARKIEIYAESFMEYIEG